MRMSRTALWAVALAAAVALPASTCLAEDDAPNKGRVSLTVGNDVTTAYMFRGILQERHGVIWQPSVGLGLNLFSDDEGPISSIDAGFGVWASYQSEETGSSGNGPDPLYEMDFYPSLSVAFANGFKTGLTYYFYTSPNGAFNTVGELSWTMGFDDTGLICDYFSLQPAAEFAFEMDNTSLGNGKGIFSGVSLSPNTTLRADTKYPVTFTMPLKVGLSADQYYYDPSDGLNDNETFGFFLFGLNGSVPLGIIPAEFGTWTVGLGINVYVLGNNLKDLNENDSPFPVGTFSLGMSY